MTGLWLVIIFFVLLLFHVPIMISLGVASVIYCVLLTDTPMDMIMNTYFSSLDSFTLVAIPFFILAGDLMMHGGISTRLIQFCRSLMGAAAGALGCVTVVASMIFAAVAGSGTATVACIGGITIPEMLKERYEKGFACSLAAVSGALGPIIPPSVAMIIYGVICSVSITDLFLGGIIPGVMIAAGLVFYTRRVSKKKGYGQHSREEMEIVSFRKSFREAVWALFVPVIILGGIYGGIFTPTEAAIVACDYALIVGVFVYKEIKFKDLPKVFKRTAMTTGTIMLLVSCASALGRLLTIERIPMKIAEMLLQISDNKIIILLIVNLFLLLVGMLMETYAAIIILAPVLLPAVQQAGVSPLHFGLIMVVNLTIGLCTPPVGVNLFVAGRIGGISVEKMFRPLIPIIGVLLVVLAVVTYIPQTVTAIPDLLK